MTVAASDEAVATYFELHPNEGDGPQQNTFRAQQEDSCIGSKNTLGLSGSY